MSNSNPFGGFLEGLVNGMNLGDAINDEKAADSKLPAKSVLPGGMSVSGSAGGGANPTPTASPQPAAGSGGDPKPAGEPAGGPSISASGSASAGTPASPPAAKSSGLNPTAGDVFNGLVARGFTPTQAAAVTGNIQAESGFRTGFEGDRGLPGGSSFGLMQWREGRLANLKAEGARQGRDWRDLNVQLDHIKNEATGGDSGFAQWFKSTQGTNDVHGAASSFASQVERPSAAALAQSLGHRTGAALKAFDQFGAGAPVGGGSAALGAPASPISITASGSVGVGASAGGAGSADLSQFIKEERARRVSDAFGKMMKSMKPEEEKQLEFQANPLAPGALSNRAPRSIFG